MKILQGAYLRAPCFSLREESKFMSENILEFQNITKRFGGTVALNDVSFTVKKGQTTGLIGENGAGKSTLVKICDGIHQPDRGQVIFEGQPQKIKSPKQAEKMGISVVHQELPLCFNMNVMDNIFLGPSLPGGKFFPDKKFMKKKTEELFDRLNVNIDPEKKIADCSIGERQLVMIAKAISKNARLIIMDEPTSALSPAEVSVLYKVIETLEKEGITFIFISHRLEEVIKVAREICVLKDGEFVGKLSKEESSQQKMIKMMVGRDVKYIDKIENDTITNDVILEVKNLNSEKLGLKNISFTLKKGEILGFAGLRGSGRTETIKSIIGFEEKDSGEIYVEGQKVEIKSPSDAINKGIGYLTEERQGLGLFFNFNIKSNLGILELDDLSKFGLVQKKKIDRLANEYKNKLDIKLRSIDQNISELSGGNQQKVLLSRWLSSQPKILILDEPTRGIDVGTKTEIRKLIMELAREGYSIILISSEMLEVMNIADRLLVFSEGKITGEFTHEEATEEKIMNSAVAEL